MEFYYSHETTPLNFHKAFYKVISPILIVFYAVMLLATIGNLVGDWGYYNTGSLVLNLFIYILAIIFLASITYGFTSKKEYAWYMVYAYLVLIAFSNLISAVLSYNVATAIGRVIGGLFLPIVIGIYYYKRKPLFVTSFSANTDETLHNSQNNTPSPKVYQDTPRTTTYTTTERAQQHSIPQQHSIQFCRKCGNKITISGSAFCNKCGEKLEWN